MPEPSAPRCPRADAFGLLPEETADAWTRHVLDLRQSYRPVDAAETRLVTAIAAAMWLEIRADRLQAEVLADILPAFPGRSHGSDLRNRTHATALSTVIRLATAAGCATGRALRAFLDHRRARAKGLIGPALARTPEPERTPTRTHEPEPAVPRYTPEPDERAPARTREPEEFLPARTGEPEEFLPARTGEPEECAPARTGEPEECAPARTGEPEECAPARTGEPEPAARRWPGPAPANDPDPVDTLRRRILGLLAGPGPKRQDEHDLAAALRAAKLPGAAPYRGPIDRKLLEEALQAFTLDEAALHWLAGTAPRTVSG